MQFQLQNKYLNVLQLPLISIILDSHVVCSSSPSFGQAGTCFFLSEIRLSNVVLGISILSLKKH